MSHYTSVKTTYKSLSDLVAALCLCGFTEEQIELSEENDMTLIGYDNAHRIIDGQVVKAALRIHRRHVGRASNDIGYVKQADGTYSAIISNYDKRKYGKSWQDSVKREYNARIATRQLQRKGYKVNVIRNGKTIRVEGKQ